MITSGLEFLAAFLAILEQLVFWLVPLLDLLKGVNLL
jgi:hypothetical protein